MAHEKELGISRREFARRAALSAAASLAPVSLMHAEPTNAEAQAPPAADLSSQSQAEVDARIHAILSQYGSRLSDDQKTDLRRLAKEAQAPLDRLRAFTVTNGDGPALYLKPLIEREKPPAAKSSNPSAPAAPKKS